MGFDPLVFDTAQGIDGIGPDFLRVGGRVLRGALMVSPWGAQVWGGVADVATPLTLAGRIDVLIFGAGAQIMAVPPGFRAALDEAGIGVEPMSTALAARTFNLLIGEGRRVALVAYPSAHLPLGHPG